MKPCTRRHFLASSAALLAGALAVPAAVRRPRHLLLRSSWQAVNIGDVGHTPGALRLLEIHLPDVEVTLWPASALGNVEPMLRKAFPKLAIARGDLKDGKASTKELQDAIDRADLLLHGSGPSVVARAQLAGWRKTGKPYGVYGVTVESADEALRDLLSNAAFVFLRDTDSLAYLKKEGVKPPVLEFGPDATFGIHLCDDEKALPFLKTNGLEERKFLCAIPRLRYTPYPHLAKEELARRVAINDKHKEADHAKLREAIVAWVRQTGLKVLVCPEMTYQLELLRPLLVDPLPEDVKKQVVRRETFWLPDEAGSVYARAHTIVSFEMHSPIISAAIGTPAIHLRQPTDTRKGQMWRDVGLGDWLFEIEPTKGEQIAKTLLGVHADYAAAQAKLKQAMDFVRKRQKETMAVVGRTLGG